MHQNLSSVHGLAARHLLLLVLLAGCASNVLPPSPTEGPSPTAVPTDVGATPRPSAPSQTDTEWGRIWDAVPESFPRYPGASPTETGEGPASAILDAGTAEAAVVSPYYRDALEHAGFTVSASGPFEDGSFEIEATAVAGCAARITISPLGGATLITILYGADCPFS